MCRRESEQQLFLDWESLTSVVQNVRGGSESVSDVMLFTSVSQAVRAALCHLNPVGCRVDNVPEEVTSSSKLGGEVQTVVKDVKPESPIEKAIGGIVPKL